MTLNINRVLATLAVTLLAAAPWVQPVIQFASTACNGGIGCGV